MSEKHEVIVAGGGHNGLTAACYLAKAGVDVCVVERHPYVGGGVLSRDLAAPGFKTDVCSLIHFLIMSNPLITNDELGLLSKYGLEYVCPDVQMAVHFHDETYMNLCSPMDMMLESIAKISERDAEAYKRFYEWTAPQLGILLQGLYSPPPPFGAFAAMMDQSDEGRDLLKAMMSSCLDLIDEWFENDKIKIAFTRWVSEIMINPHVKGTGIVFYLMIPMMHKYPGGLPIGGSGALSQAMERCILDLGGTIRTSCPIKEFKVEGGDCTGVVLEDGEEILASKAVLSNLHIQHMFPGMVQGAQLPDGFETRVKRLRSSGFMCFHQGLALHEAPKYKVGDELDKAFLVEFAPNSIRDYIRYFQDIELGYTVHNPLVSCQTLHDPTRAPEGKHTIYFYEYAPYDLADGGAARWDEIREQYADEVLEFLRQYTTNMGPENIIGRWIQSPLDLERHNPSYIKGDFAQIGGYLDQSMGNRPLSGWNYRTPIGKLFMTGPGTHPGTGVAGGGRAAVQAVLEELDIDFEDLVSK